MAATSRSSEVLIVGAGPVGLFAALRLGQAGIKTTVIEKEAEISQLPRACMYYPQVQFALQDAGIWNDIVEGGGFRTTGLDIRLPPVSDDQGGKRPGELVANFPREPNFDPKVDAYGPPVQPPSMSMLNMPQPLLGKVLLEKAIETSNVEVLFGKELVSILDGSKQDSAKVRVLVRDGITVADEEYQSSFLVGADGGRSKTRSLLDIPFPGRQVFQFFVDPVSSWSKLRIQSGETDDWFFRALKDTSSPSFANYVNTLQNVWPTHVRQMAASLPTAASAA